VITHTSEREDPEENATETLSPFSKGVPQPSELFTCLEKVEQKELLPYEVTKLYEPERIY
jgi:hypothetical protein